ncbi:conserved hypothetical protein [Methylocella silvestris BL2]|uniref:Uncharacterized protein n=1 Tax=Methylocella silvestris (strain DSM 15510 / CIP 108128 / LMG 27833 / NCIMB 13906 / BL2) TaxID=395965 RepID=B8ERA1_METSB|nr:conserved hypothetical protein [Methylocella silvestris BL2]
MGRGIRYERQVLSVDEVALVASTHHPALGALSDEELAKLRTLVRERRDRARDIAARQRREMRGKAAAKGARPAADDTGSRGKRDLLAAAMKRINGETTRREGKAAREAMKDSAQRALALRSRREAESARRPATRTAGEGMRPSDSKATKQRNRAKLGAVSQHTKNMQAKRDGR